MNLENAMVCSLAPAPPACTTLQSRTPESRITNQNATVLTVEFTLNAPNLPSGNFRNADLHPETPSDSLTANELVELITTYLLHQSLFTASLRTEFREPKNL